MYCPSTTCTTSFRRPTSASAASTKSVADILPRCILTLFLLTLLTTTTIKTTFFQRQQQSPSHSLFFCHGFPATSRAKRQQRGLAQVGRTPKLEPFQKTNNDKNYNSGHDDDESTTTSITPTTVTMDRELLWNLAGHTSRRKRKRGHVPSIQLGNEEEQEENGTDSPTSSGITTATLFQSSKSVAGQSYSNIWVQPQDIQSVELVWGVITEEQKDEKQRQEPQSGQLKEETWLADVTFVNGTKQSNVHTQTLHQRTDNAIWMATRAMLNVTASELGAIVGNSVFTTREQLAQKKAGRFHNINNNNNDDAKNNTIHDNSIKNGTASTTRSFVGNQKACDWGIRMEPKALKQYVQVTGNKVTETGLHIRRFSMDTTTGAVVDPPGPTSPLLLIGASPDGLVVESSKQNGNRPRMGLLEIKCLWGRRHKKELPQFDHCPKRFYDQIQGQLAVCDLDFCDLMMYIPPSSSSSSGKKKQQRKNYCILRVPRDDAYWKGTLLPAVQSFCVEVDELRRTGLYSSSFVEAPLFAEPQTAGAPGQVENPVEIQVQSSVESN